MAILKVENIKKTYSGKNGGNRSTAIPSYFYISKKYRYDESDWWGRNKHLF